MNKLKEQVIWFTDLYFNCKGIFGFSSKLKFNVLKILLCMRMKDMFLNGEATSP